MTKAAEARNEKRLSLLKISSERKLEGLDKTGPTGGDEPSFAGRGIVKDRRAVKI
jgi:hypothetical protein